MGKTRITYVVMILAFALGLWAILRAGHHLRAAPDISGEWEIRWSQKSDLPDRMTLAQSGRFLNAKLHGVDQNQFVTLRGTLERNGDAGGTIVLKGTRSETTLTAMFDGEGQELVGKSDAGTPANWRRHEGGWYFVAVSLYA